ncbi:response regulator transcription factor [Pedobacter sp. ASV28]|uniref:response regulator n=1 Tax=Pedobacter sp. ASV28 TaxID=2795123 RepID=UPI0018EAEAA5|nr:response regulator transcription factor [Pedobacter sp. ASV28]
MSNKVVKVIIADDHALFADGLEQIVGKLPNFEVLAKVNNGKLLIQRLNVLLPDLILMDLNMPYLNGLEAAEMIKKHRPGIKIIIISMYCDNRILDILKQKEIDAFIIKDSTAPILKQAILDVLEGKQVFISPSSEKKAINKLFTDTFEDLFKLGAREIEIIKLIRDGKSTKQIAYDLELSIYTIETHRKNIYRKLGIQGTAELINFANKHNL